jgi:hypothetical protein
MQAASVRHTPRQRQRNADRDGEIMQQLGLEASALADRPVGPFGSADHGCAGKTVSQPTSASDELKALVNALPA